MKMRSSVVIALVSVLGLSLAACEKSDGGKASGPLSSADAELFKSLPTGSNVVFGGNYMKLQNFMQNTALGKMTKQMTDAAGKGLTEWMECFAALKDLKVAGAVSMAGKKGAELRMVFSGAGVKDITNCANKAGFKVTADADNKFVGIEVVNPMGNQTQGYLVLPSGNIYTRQAFSLGGMMSVTPATRAELEGDVAGLAKGTVADDKKIQDLVSKVDRSKTMWFAGSADGTPLADKVGEMYGSLEISPGVAIDVTVQVTDSSLAKQAEEGIDQMKSMADQLPGDLKSVVKDLEFKRNGDRLRFAVKMSDAQISSIMSTMGGMMGGLGRMH
jgi:hypothetical protein